MRQVGRAAATAAAMLLTAGTASAHHVMGGVLPASVTDGLLSGFGHPVIGLDHLAALLAIGCLAALHRRGAALVVGYVAATMLGAAVHVRGANLPASEALVALSVVALGAVLVWKRAAGAVAALALFAVAGLFHGYALGESIVGAERSPLLAYFTGLAAIQTGIGLAVLFGFRLLAAHAARRLDPAPYLGAVVIAAGLIALATQFTA